MTRVLRNAIALVLCAWSCCCCFAMLAAPCHGKNGHLEALVGRTSPLNREIYRMVFEDRTLLETRVRDALKRYLDDPSRVEIKLVPDEPAKLLGGGFKEIICKLEDTMVKDLRVEQAYVRLRNCTLDFEKLLRQKKFRFKDEGEVDLFLKVTETDVNELFTVKRKKLKVRNPRLDFRPGHLRFSGGIKVLFFKNHVRVAGLLRVKDGDKIYFHPRWMNIDFLPVPGFIVRTIAKRINPMATFESFKFKVNLSIIETTHDALYVASESMRERVDELVAEDLAAREKRLHARRMQSRTQQ